MPCQLGVFIVVLKDWLIGAGPCIHEGLDLVASTFKNAYFMEFSACTSILLRRSLLLYILLLAEACIEIRRNKLLECTHRVV